jgi:RNA polymerase sigma-70 factor (ECF subfamily)
LKEARNIAIMPGTDQATDPEGGSEKPDIRTLFEEEESPLLRYAFSLTGRRAVAEELVQEVFLQLYKHWETVKNPKAWLYRSIRNRSYNYHRDNSREILTGDEQVNREQASNGTPGDLLQRMEAAGFLRLLLSELDEKDRELIDLKYYQDLKYAEISEKTGVSVGNVGYRLHHILKHLAGKLRQIGIEGTETHTSI